MNSREHFVYWLFAADGDCLYVGMTTQPKQRWGAHRRRFGAEVAFKRMSGPYTAGVARRIEREQQDELRPKYDGKWGRIRKREQEREEQSHWPVYSIAEAAELFGMPEEELQKHVQPYRFLRIPDDEVSSA